MRFTIMSTENYSSCTTWFNFDNKYQLMSFVIYIAIWWRFLNFAFTTYSFSTIGKYETVKTYSFDQIRISRGILASATREQQHNQYGADHIKSPRQNICLILRYVISAPRGMRYSNWAAGQGPYRDHGFIFGDIQDCGMVRTDDHYRWHDGPCAGGPAFMYSFICQYGKYAYSNIFVSVYVWLLRRLFCVNKCRLLFQGKCFFFIPAMACAESGYT